MTRYDKVAVRTAVTVSQAVADLMGQPLKQRGRERLATCPFHEDASPSLRIDDEKGSWYCDPCATGGDVFAFTMRLKDLTFGDAVRYLGERYQVTPETESAQAGPQRREVAAYDYTDTDGTVVAQVVRYAPKDFRQRRPDGSGGWLWKLAGLQLPLYRLHDLSGHATVYVVEGERDVCRLWDVGLAATCNAGGAGKWQERHTYQLVEAGAKNIVVVPDNDQAGAHHADTVARSGVEAGLRVKVVDLDQSEKGADVSDFLSTRLAKDLTDRCLLTPFYVTRDPGTPAAGAPDEDGGIGASPHAGCRDVYRPVGDRTDGLTTRSVPASGDRGVSLDDFHAYMPQHSYIFAPSREPWPVASVNARLPPVPLLDAAGHPVLDAAGVPIRLSPSTWLDRHRPVEQMTWAPGRPMLVRDRLVADGGWIKRPNCTVFNLYRPPLVIHGDATKATPWLDHLRRVYPDDHEHIAFWLAHRVQRPEEKINHALVQSFERRGG